MSELRVPSLDELLSAAGMWLWSAQNEQDGGWGQYQGHPSRIVNSCEALLAASYALPDEERMKRGLAYLTACFAGSTHAIPQHQRHYAFGALTFARLAPPQDDLMVDAARTTTERLLSFTTPDGGWSHYRTADKTAPATYATYLGVRALVAVLTRLPEGDRPSLLPTLQNALVFLSGSRQAEGGWAFSAEEEANPAATAFAVLGLLEGAEIGGMPALIARDVPPAVRYLLAHLNDSRVVAFEQKLGGNAVYAFHYFATPWVLNALFHAGERPWQPAIWAEFEYLLSLRRSDGSWAEATGRGPNVWATYGAVECLRAIGEAFRPQTELLQVSQMLVSSARRAKQSAQLVTASPESRAMIVGAGLSDLVEFGAGPVRLQMTVLLFAFGSVGLAIVFALFLLSGTAISPAEQLGVNVVVPAISFVVVYVWCRQVAHAKWQVAFALAALVAPLLLAIELARYIRP